MAFIEDTISSEIVYEGPIFKIRKHRVNTIAGESTRDVLEHRGGAVMLAITDQGKVLMEKQYRKPLERIVLELPAGKIDSDEDPIVTARRELAEETGYRASEIRELMRYNPTCGYSNETLYIYICKGLTAGATNMDATESLDVLEYEADELIQMIMRNEIKDSKTIIGLLFARAAGEI